METMAPNIATMPQALLWRNISRQKKSVNDRLFLIDTNKIIHRIICLILAKKLNN